MKPIFTGVCTALITPFRCGEVDFLTMAKLIERQIAAEVDALCILGTTGEASTLTEEEKNAIIRFSLKIVAGRIPIIFGIGGNYPDDIIKNGLFIKNLTALPPNTAVMVSAPYYNKCSQAGAVKYFRHIANKVGLPLIVYNVPARTGVNLSPQTLGKIAKNRYVRGIKEASSNIEQISAVINAAKVPVYCGDDTIALPCYAVGCAGIVSVASNVRPKDIRAIWVAKNLAKGRKLFLSQLEFYKSLFREVNPMPVKFEMARLELCRNELRLPLTPIEE